MKKKFNGIYYKHQTLDGYTLAVIVSNSSEGKMIQIITNENSYLVKDTSSVYVSFQGIIFDVHQEDLNITGHIYYGKLTKPKKDIMSYYRFLPIECKHKVYSLHQRLLGCININNKQISFDDGDGYIEGDKGRNFPQKYVWINASSAESSIVLAIASIPLGFGTITGTTCIIKNKNKEYRFGTYNGASPLEISKNEIVISKGSYMLKVNIEEYDSHALKAPQEGCMCRFIHESPSVGIRYELRKHGKLIFDVKHPYASVEYMY